MKEIEISYPIGRELPVEEIKTQGARALGVSLPNFAGWKILKRSIDARGGKVEYRLRLEVYSKGETPSEYILPAYQNVENAEPVIIIGAGPAGMFAALSLLMNGLRPIILERGKDVHSRKSDMASLSRNGELDEDSNYCFGEGGAGTFSDGKLYTRSSKRGDIREVLTQLVAFGAPEEILIDAHPHIGSDRLPLVVENIRKCIVGHGGEYHFESKVVDLQKAGNKGIEVRCANGESFTAKNVILSTGHSARDVYELFSRLGWALQAKGFALGVRVEHPQSLINKIQYSGKYQPFMPAAEYSFVQQVEGRGVFSFCMCPGGLVIPSPTIKGELALNGMSPSARSGKTANAGVVVQVEPEDYPDYISRSGALGLLDFQREVEKKMYDFSSSYSAPAQRLMDFCRGIPSSNLPLSTYRPSIINAPLGELLPRGIYRRLSLAFPYVGNKLMKGYYTNDALVMGVESRTSSPVRIVRDPETLQSPSLPGLYPCGEGAGYSGGIVSSALDGIRCALKIAGK